jgi:hypothetical protein
VSRDGWPGTDDEQAAALAARERQAPTWSRCSARTACAASSARPRCGASTPSRRTPPSRERGRTDRALTERSDGTRGPRRCRARCAARRGRAGLVCTHRPGDPTPARSAGRRLRPSLPARMLRRVSSSWPTPRAGASRPWSGTRPELAGRPIASRSVRASFM